MSYLLDSLPQFRRIAKAESVHKSELLPNAVIVAEDTEQLFIDTPEKRIDLSPIRHIRSKTQLPTEGSEARAYLTDQGMLYMYAGGAWHEFAPQSMADSTYMYRFEVTDNTTEELRFSQTALQVTYTPEFDIIDANGYNITNSDFITRRWDADTYIITYSGGWPKGEYFLKLSNTANGGGQAAAEHTHEIVDVYGLEDRLSTTEKALGDINAALAAIVGE